MDDYDIELNERMDRILTATANALHGGYAPPDCLHSWHDLPELVEQLRKERDEARKEICYFLSATEGPAHRIAEKRGWDCFKDNP
jgi:hypothetical protein